MEKNLDAKMQWIEKVRARDVIADETKKANEQHYEVNKHFYFKKARVGYR
jgi:hypothetical protein